MSKPEFYTPTERSRKGAEMLLSIADPDLVYRTLLDLAYYEEDWRWVQEQCLERLHAPQPLVKRGALYGLQILADVRHELEPGVVKSAVYASKRDCDVAQLAQDGFCCEVGK
jgi:hypothetical protein